MKNTFLLLCFWICSASTLLAQEWTRIPYEDISSDGLNIISLYEDADGHVWGGNSYAGRIIRWDGTTWEVFNNAITGLTYESPSVGEIFQDADGLLWFCSFGDGLATFDGTTWTNYNTSNSSIPSNLVSDVIEKDGKLWFTMAKKLVSYDGSNWEATEIPDITWFAGGLAALDDGSFFVSILNGNPIRKYDGTNWEIFSLDNSNVASDYQYYVEKVDGQTFWFGGPNGRATLYDNGTFIPSGDISGWSLGLGDYILKMAINGSKDDVWFATGGGLAHLKNNNWTRFDPSNSPMTTSEVQSVLIASDGKIWSSTETEILIYDPSGTTNTKELSNTIGLNILSNPVQSNLHLTIENEESIFNENALITIYNLAGQALMAQKVGEKTIDINVEQLSAGTYILEYADPTNKASKQFVKK